MAETTEIGQIGWIDISIDDAKELSDFYSSVIEDPAGAVAGLYQAT